MGAHIGLSQGASPVIAIVMGILTASFGGILRDVLAGETSVILRDEIYITCALLGAAVYVLGSAMNWPTVWVFVAATSAAFSLRAGALLFSWKMPRYKPRQGRA